MTSGAAGVSVKMAPPPKVQPTLAAEVTTAAPAATAAAKPLAAAPGTGAAPGGSRVTLVSQVRPFGRGLRRRTGRETFCCALTSTGNAGKREKVQELPGNAHQAGVEQLALAGHFQER